MKILVLNSGSSSLKYQLLEMPEGNVICKGTFERIGENSFVTHKINGEKYEIEHPCKDHGEALKFVFEQILNPNYPAISSLNEITAIGHRIGHGGELFDRSVVVDDDVLEKLEQVKDLAPLHNPPAIAGIRACQRILPNVKNICAFDTAFHTTIPENRKIYPLPYRYYKELKVRKYGFHGMSHKYVSERISQILDNNNLKIINCHLGQGASICAIKDGKSQDISMGSSPVAGIPMGTRAGDLDPSIVTFLMKKENLSADEMNQILNKESGVAGMSGVSNDFRDIEKASREGNERAKVTIDVFCYKVSQFIMDYIVALDGVDVITFTAGIGENQSEIRKQILNNLSFLGVKVDDTANATRGEEIKITTEDSKIQAWVIPTNEEYMIAQDTINLL